MKEEYLDVYDDNGNVTGKVIIRGDKNAKLLENEHISVAVIFIQNDKNEFLIQKTSKEKGGYFSSTGGHVNMGENPLDAIKREVKEEIGVDISNDEIKEYGFITYDMPLRYLFYLRKNIDIKEVTLQKEEVEYVEFMNVSNIKKLIKSGEMLESHGIMFEKILSKIKNNSYVIALAIDGKNLSSEELAETIDKLGIRGISHIVFVIGGSLGLAEAVLKRADYKLSFSKMTFPHQLMRVILLEQIYRAYRIMKNEPYHK